MTQVEELLREVLERVTPTPAERERVSLAVSRVVRALERAARELQAKVEVEVEGSFAKDTWLSGDVDVDVFLLFEPDVPVEELRSKGLQIARRAAEMLGVGWRERYASHPYLTLELGVCEVDAVPAYRVPSPAHIKSPVDRTPFHTAYVKRKLDANPSLRGEVRLLKRFAKGIGVYGAEVKVEGFSGYLLELLAIHYGSLVSTLEAAAGWRPFRTVVDLEGHYSDPREALRRFREPLVVVDPVDPKRNVASPVSLDSLGRFIAAARAFLRKPGLEFFYPNPPPPRQPDELVKGRAVAAVKLRVPQLPEDVLWGQAKRALRALAHGLERLGFKVFDRAAWAEGGELVLLFELESLELPPLEKHYGPPVYSDHDARFVSKYAEGGCAAGPYVEGDKWVVIRPRRVRRADEALAKLVATYNIGEDLTPSARSGFEVYAGEGVLGASASAGYKRFLAEWLARRPPWLSSSGA
jgi:tRNA nucleotidyltransferase (CCA-adding enzyme)